MWMTAQEEEDGFVLASTFVKKTEDQLDPYREWMFLVLDHPQDIFGWTSKRKERMRQFKEDLVAQISEATELPESRLRVQRVLKANKKKSWVALESKSPAFYLGKLLIWCCVLSLSCRLFAVSSFPTIWLRVAVQLWCTGFSAGPVTDLRLCVDFSNCQEKQARRCCR